MDGKTAQSGKELTAPQRRAAVLVAEDALTEEKIAAEVGIAPRTLRSWKVKPDFQRAVREHALRIEASISRFWITKRIKRVETLQRLADALFKIIAERAADPAMEGVPGGASGLIVRDVKIVGYGDDAEVVSVYRVDTALSAELRNTLKQAAQEVGQWSEKYDIPGAGAEAATVFFFLPEKGSAPPVFVDDRHGLAPDAA